MVRTGKTSYMAVRRRDYEGKAYVSMIEVEPVIENAKVVQWEQTFKGQRLNLEATAFADLMDAGKTALNGDGKKK